MRLIFSILLLTTSLFADDLGQISKFEFSDSNNEKFSSEELKDKVWLASFFFTSCQGVCPMINGNLSGIFQQFKSSQNFAIVSFSVDPKTDNFERLTSYANKFKADTKIWHFLRTSNSELKKLMTADLKLVSFDEPNLHSTRVVLMRADKIIAYFDGLDATSYSKIKVALANELK